MKRLMKMIKPKPGPKQQLRDWQKKLRHECLNIERQIRDIEREERKVQKDIKGSAKRNDMVTAKGLARDIVRSRRIVKRLYENKAQLSSISMHLAESVGTAVTVGNLSKSAEVMNLVNNLMKVPDMALKMQEFSKELTKAGVIDEFVSDAVDDALDYEDVEDEIEEEVEKVLTAIAGETAAQLPEAVKKEKINVPARKTKISPEEESIAQGVGNEEELEEIGARFAKLRS
ncbi:vacuolar protein sorting-associated protein 24 homolog 1 [Capsella rubella]|nr:vacuolar protein sorting-associated protein 24 homolog 1 [Capsella rubella]